MKRLSKASELFPEIKRYSYLFKDKIYDWGTIHELYFDESVNDLQRFYLLLCTFHDNSNYVFRGQSNGDNGEQWKLSSTWHRNNGNPTATDVKSYLTQIENLPDELASDYTIEKLMLAQHHHYYTPLLDFSYNPYKALYFAFKNVQSSKHYSTIYILLHQNFRNTYANFLLRHSTDDALGLIKKIHAIGGDFHIPVLENQEDIDDSVINEYHQKKMLDKTTKLSELPENRIYIIPNSLSSNSNMLKQEGIFIYDMLHYESNSQYGTNLEDFISKLEISDVYRPSLIKVHISKKHTDKIHLLLEEYNINDKTLGLEQSVDNKNL